MLRDHLKAGNAVTPARGLLAATLAGALAAAPAAPALAASGGQTNLYVEANESTLTTPEGYGDDNIKTTIPVAIGYVADASGALTGPADGATLITNNSSTGAVHVARIHAVPASGVTLVTSAAAADEDDEIYLPVTPGDGTADCFGNYTTAAAPADADGWDVAQGSSLALNGLGGQVGGFSTIDPSTKFQVASIEWTVAAGTYDQAQAEADRLVIHQVAPDNSVTDLVTTKSAGAGTLQAGYTWHLTSSTGTTVSTVADIITAAGNASEISVWGTLV